MSDNTGKSYAEGHAIYTGEGAEKTMLAEGITFVDGKNWSDAGQDGSFEHPYTTIRQALAKAGENAVLFVADGEYKEEVELRPGQTLTSEIAGFATAKPPLIRPDYRKHDFRHIGRRRGNSECSTEYIFASVVTMRENTTLRRMELATDGGCKHERIAETDYRSYYRSYSLTAIWVEPEQDAEDFVINVEDNILYAAGGGWDAALWMRLGRIKKGRVQIVRNICRCPTRYGIYMELARPPHKVDLRRKCLVPDPSLHQISLRENLIESPNGVECELHGAGDTFDCSANAINAQYGIEVRAYSENAVTLCNNRIVSTFRGASVNLSWCGSTTLSLQGNTIRANGKKASGVSIGLNEKSPFLAPSQVAADNDIQVNGENAVAVAVECR